MSPCETLAIDLTMAAGADESAPRRSMRRMTGCRSECPGDGNHTIRRPSCGKVLAYGMLAPTVSTLTNSIVAFFHVTTPPPRGYLSQDLLSASFGAICITTGRLLGQNIQILPYSPTWQKSAHLGMAAGTLPSASAEATCITTERPPLGK